MNRLDAFMSTMALVLETKLSELRLLLAQREGPPDELLEAKIILRIRQAYAEYLADSCTLPSARTAALNAMLLVSVPALIANPEVLIAPLNREGISSTTVGEGGVDNE